MEQSKRLAQPDDRSLLTLHEIEIVLSNLNTIPGRINPDFLRHNQIVDPEWILQRPVILQPDHSRIQYGNGLSFSATEESVTISQSLDGRTLNEIVCPEVVEKYLRISPGEFPYMEIEINPSSYIEFQAGDLRNLSSPLKEIGLRIPFNDVFPTLQTRVEYDLPDKNITLFVAETTRAEDNFIRLHLNGEILRVVEGYSFDEQIPFLTGVLGRWIEDIKDFSYLASQFGAMYTIGEN